MNPSDTLVINLLAGPGAGKSTMAACVFGELKLLNINCELASEFAKDLVWEKRDKTFENQLYIFGKQHHRIFRLLGQVQVVITDSPLFLTPLYDSEKRECLRELVFNEVNKCRNFNVFINRKKTYNPKGRIHTHEQANIIDNRVKDFLKKWSIPFIEVDGTRDGTHEVVTRITKILEVT